MILQVQDKVIERAKELLPGLRQAEPYAGQFSADGPNRGRVFAPSFFVAVLDAPLADEQPMDGRMALDVRFAAYCLAQNAQGAASRSADALSMATTFAYELSQMVNWGLGVEVQQSRLEGVQNLYTAALDNKGLGLYSVVWNQVVMIGEGIWQGGETPTEVWVGIFPEQFPDDYEQVSEAPDAE